MADDFKIQLFSSGDEVKIPFPVFTDKIKGFLRKMEFQKFLALCDIFSIRAEDDYRIN